MKIEPGVVDANILVYALDTGAPQYAASNSLLKAASNPATVLYLTSQVLCEFYSIVTNRRPIVAPYSGAEALEEISAILVLPGIRVLPIPAQAVEGWMALLQRRPVTGSNVFDLQLVATMLANGIQRIYTFNTRDFEAFPELTVVVPAVRP
jgi:uncharacterized protein